MKIFDQRFTDNDQLSLVTSLASEFGSTDDMTVNFVVAEDFPQNEIDVWKILVDAESNGQNRLAAIEHFATLIHKMTPFVGKPIVRAGVWLNEKLHMMYIDRIGRRTIHSWSLNYPDPAIGHPALQTEDTNNPMDRSGGSAAS